MTKRTSPPDIKIIDDHALVELTQGQFAIIDSQDVEKVAPYIWNCSEGYAFCSKLNIRLHQFLLGYPPKGMIIDHEDRNPLNCRRKNLRFVNRSRNVHNSDWSDDKGVNQIAKTGRWRARLGQMQLGMFDTKEEAQAIVARVKKMKEEFDLMPPESLTIEL